MITLTIAIISTIVSLVDLLLGAVVYGGVFGIYKICQRTKERNDRRERLKKIAKDIEK